MSPSPRAHLVLTGLLGALLVAMAARAGLPRGDFANYWTAATVWAEGGPLTGLYDYRWFTEQAARAGFGDQLVGFPVLTPPSALFLAPLLPLGLTGARVAWWLVQVLLLLATGLVGARVARLPGWAGLLAMALAWPALQSHLVQGQAHLPAALLVVTGLLLWRRDQPVPAGALWGLAAGLKVFAWPLLLVALAAGRWRASVAGLGVLLLGGLVSVGLLGWEVHALWFGEIAPAAASGFFMDPWHPGMQSVAALAHHLWLPLPGVAPAALAKDPALAYGLPAFLGLALPLLSWAAARAWSTLDEADRSGVLAAGALAALASAPFLAGYSLVLLPPVLLMVMGARWRGGARAAAVVVGLLALAVVWAPSATEWPDDVARSVLAAPRGPLMLLLWASLLPWRQLQRPSLSGGLMALGLSLVAAQAAIPRIALDDDRALPLRGSGAPLVAAELALSEGGEALVFSGLSADRQGAPGAGWLGFSWALDASGAATSAPQVVASAPAAHTWAPEVAASGALSWSTGPTGVHPDRDQPGVPCAGGTLQAVQRDGQQDLELAREGVALSLTTHPAHDAWPVCDEARGRIWFLSDRGAGVRALRVWWVPLP